MAILLKRKMKSSPPKAYTLAVEHTQMKKNPILYRWE